MKLKFEGHVTFGAGTLEGRMIVKKNGIEVYRFEGIEKYSIVLHELNASTGVYIEAIASCPQQVVEIDCPDGAKVTAFGGYKEEGTPEHMTAWLNEWGLSGADVPLNMVSNSRDIEKMRSAMSAWKEMIYEG